MNRKPAFTYIFLCVTLLSILLTGIFFYTNEQPENVYILKEYNGNIAVYLQGNSEPLEILDAKIKAFPEKDKLMLKNGITVYSKEELYRLIEDFSG